ncbi:MAG: CDP-alcohol phosphatidyltransferase family protein [Elusimicrobia bacterium]|nr:CDP-alcohol phosphatidyltransferase family protein [Elusimicrobiota bacterium]
MRAMGNVSMDGVLLVNHPAYMMERLAGLTLIERQVFTLARAGLRRVWIAAHKPSGARFKALRWPQDIEVVWTSETRSFPAAPHVSISADYLIRPAALREVLATRHEQPTAYHDSAGRGVIQIMLSRGEEAPSFEKRALPDGSCLLIQTPLESGPALPWVLREAVKSHDSFMARHFDRRISLAITRRLLDTRLTPNQMTALSTLVGVAGALLTLGGPAAMTAGVLLVWAHTVLDGCDGEMARLRFESSRIGGILDFWGDNVVHAALFLCLGIGAWRQGRSAVYPLLGLLAATGAALAALSVYRHSQMRRTRHGPLFNGLGGLASEKSSRAVRNLALIEDALSRRDFVYLLVALVLIGHPEIFLWAAGIGMPLFLSALLYLRNLENRSLPQ